MEPYNKLQDIIEAVVSPDFSHSRCRRWCGVDLTFVYHKSSTPSGVHLAIGDREEIVEPILKKYGRTSSLSPVEGL